MLQGDDIDVTVVGSRYHLPVAGGSGGLGVEGWSEASEYWGFEGFEIMDSKP
jgi:hypothetical protein